MAARRQQEEEPEERSRAAGGCVLVVLGGGALAVVFAVSTEAGILAVWVVGTVALWRSARRRMSDSSATPPPPSEGDVYAAHSDEIDRVQEGPGEGLLILYPKRVEREVKP
ncbi:hypothetical protein [Streptomyces kebangsaanensis]|uniref:hypothetical protein n=1 Tax=Streptomyces kebangsaanensis TaxID=864058 RepID=UPI000B194E9B|nr:hypothetical protein [Streptomyces kebangsaanensis]